MRKSTNELRLQFYAQTNIEIKNEQSKSCKDAKPCASTWQKYAIWLENFQAAKLNQQVLQENNLLRNTIYEVLDILETSITKRI